MADGVRVLGLHQVALRATDLDASIAFYRDVLGLPFIARFDPPGIAFFDLGGPRLMLEAGSVPNGEAGAGEAVLYHAVSDLDATCAALEAAGVEVTHPPALVHRDDDGTFGAAGEEEWMAFVHDPSGNLVGLAHRRPV